ncbi:hypothetical protein CEXT_785471 [Caerostris extrusa]|uniref:Uncharacterized protein n=1 Tax=Caerostris extrusa TaxID=172846 RepID=A0AAV4NTS3_CAEEX|nr:hypothetical protein CEXT_785471 [Caerostris extrusa]
MGGKLFPNGSQWWIHGNEEVVPLTKSAFFNPLHCDCKIKWMLCFPDADVEGTCDTPEDYENLDIVETYHLLVEECGIDDNRQNDTRRRIGYY